MTSMDGSRVRMMLPSLSAAREHNFIRPATLTVRPNELVLRLAHGRCVAALGNCRSDLTVLDQVLENQILLRIERKQLLISRVALGLSV
jgi:hypothetical protein